MAGIKQGSYLIVYKEYGLGSFKDFYNRLITYMISKVKVSLEPAYIYARKIPNDTIRIYAIPPHTYITPGENPKLEELCVSREKCDLYILSKPAWIKTLDITLPILVELLDKLLANTVYEARLGEDKRLIFEKRECKDHLVVIDGIYRHNYSWYTGRIGYIDEKYKEMIHRTVELKPLIHVLAYSSSGEPAIYIDYSTGGSILYFKICDSVLDKYGNVVLDFIIDYISY